MNETTIITNRKSQEPEFHRLTIIVPVYNERDCLAPLCHRMDRFVDNSPVEARVLFVDDGSTDDSLKIIRTICDDRPRYHYLPLDRNRGLSTALKAGIDACETSLIGYMDADLQTSPHDFSKLIQYVSEYQMINGIRQNRNDKWVKKISSRIANSFRRLILDDGIVDTCCPMKIIWASYAKQIPYFNGFHRFLPALVQLLDGKVKQVPVDHFPRYAGSAKYHLSNRLLSPFVDCLGVLWLRHRFIRYGIRDKCRE